MVLLGELNEPLPTSDARRKNDGNNSELLRGAGISSVFYMGLEPINIIVKDTSFSRDLIPVRTENNSNFTGAGICASDLSTGMEHTDIFVKDGCKFNLDGIDEEVNMCGVIAHGCNPEGTPRLLEPIGHGVVHDSDSQVVIDDLKNKYIEDARNWDCVLIFPVSGACLIFSQIKFHKYL